MKREYPNAPIVAVGVMIRQGDRIVLVRRAKEPAKGQWTLADQRKRRNRKSHRRRSGDRRRIGPKAGELVRRMLVEM